ncbi:HD domain-containing protein [Robiginitalea sp. SC105]|uniref:HD domain-containing protein n=1 Tax=Robiginitalea sp. SC105 TaxID=2762332 RepID=UPI00163A304D|nr:HD domain-containing protein [Robiginitalea sp. SC105]MBC2839545.1 HD domain-containing protein [Robiginitalea sp. SC105]
MELVNRSLYPDICHRILDELDKKLPGYLTYHCLDHTIDVANVCEHYIEYYMISKRIARLIRIAAVSHDYGYIYSPKEHEERSIKEIVPQLKDSCSEREIFLISGMIRATKVPQEPKNIYEEIMADADLDYLGRSDYDTLSTGLYKEFMHFGVVKNECDWLDVQIRFLDNHRYHTDWAIRNRKASKLQVLEMLKNKAGTASSKAS